MEKKQSEQIKASNLKKMQKVAKKLAIVEKDKAKRKYAESKKTIVPIRKGDSCSKYCYKTTIHGGSKSFK